MKAATTTIPISVYVPEVVVVLSLNISAGRSFLYTGSFGNTVCLVHLITVICYFKTTDKKIRQRKPSKFPRTDVSFVVQSNLKRNQCRMANEYSRLGMLNHCVVLLVACCSSSVVIDVVDWQLLLLLNDDWNLFYEKRLLTTWFLGNLLGSLL